MSHTLLLADDSVTIQRFIELTFADEDISVIAVGNGDHAIATIRHTPPDIVLADVSMPGLSGYEVARHIKHTPALAHIPVLLLTGAVTLAPAPSSAQAPDPQNTLVVELKSGRVLIKLRPDLAPGRLDCHLVRALVAAGCAVTLSQTVLVPVRTRGISMLPAYHGGELLLFNRLAYRWSEPARGDIAAITFRPGVAVLVKRIVALPGERVVILSQVLADAYNIGYHDVGELVVQSVNGRAIRGMPELAAAFQQPLNGFHSVVFAPNGVRSELVLDAADFEAASLRIARAYGVPALARLVPQPSGVARAAAAPVSLPAPPRPPAIPGIAD